MLTGRHHVGRIDGTQAERDLFTSTVRTRSAVRGPVREAARRGVIHQQESEADEDTV